MTARTEALRVAVAALEEMLFNFDYPKHDEWLTQAGFEGAIQACNNAHEALARIAELEAAAPPIERVKRRYARSAVRSRTAAGWPYISIGVEGEEHTILVLYGRTNKEQIVAEREAALVVRALNTAISAMPPPPASEPTPEGRDG